MRLVPILDIDGKKQFVNPEFVTSIVEKTGKDLYQKSTNWREVWVLGHAGYHTFSIMTDEPAADLAIRLEKK